MEFRKMMNKAGETAIDFAGYAVPVLGLDVRAYRNKKNALAKDPNADISHMPMNAGDWAIVAYNTAVIGGGLLATFYYLLEKPF